MVRLGAEIILDWKWHKDIIALFELMPSAYRVQQKDGLFVITYGCKTIHIPTHLTSHYATWAKAFQEVAAGQE
jgi:hypothetical protein